jgi:hypothetical protein
MKILQAFAHKLIIHLEEGNLNRRKGREKELYVELELIANLIGNYFLVSFGYQIDSGEKEIRKVRGLWRS